ncbi:MAG: hypothetical protein H6737_29560 [Alphaproteobacteria bacterium]|nr:hypothetical protein [Alphaproteobacteria bacterium]
MRNAFVLAVLAAGCTSEESQILDQVDFQGDIPEDVDTVQATQDFLASGAQYGVIVDPVTGDTVTLTNLDRASNSADFSAAGDAACLDCGGVNATCSGPAGMQRQISVPLQRDTGRSRVDVLYRGMTNWTPVGQDCGTGDACPSDGMIDATGAPVGLDVTLIGNLSSCSAFSVYFDTEGILPVTFRATADNSLQLFVDGVAQSVPGSGTWQTVGSFTLDLTSGDHTIAVQGTNSGGVPSSGNPAMFIADVKDDLGNTLAVSDGTWKAFAGTPPSGFQNPGFDDSSWGNAVASGSGCGAFGIGPWSGSLSQSMTGANFIWANGCSSGGATVSGLRKTITVP